MSFFLTCLLVTMRQHQASDGCDMQWITDFRGPYRWLSNFHEAPIAYEGLVYATTEHAYQAAKTLDPAWRKIVQEAPKARDAKKLGSTLPLRPDWDEVRLDVMLIVNATKYTAHTSLQTKLLATENAILVEGNTWHDNFWGDCKCGRNACITPGQNQLGKTLMRIRSQLQAVLDAR